MSMFDNLLPSHTDYTRFIILCRPRTGSTLLEQMLGRHPQIRSRGEFFSRLKGRDPSVVWDRMFAKAPRRIRASGFKIHYNHPIDADHTGTWDFLASKPDLHVIHVRRENILRMLVSGRISRKLKTYNIRFPWQRPPLRKRRVIIEHEELTRVIQATEGSYRHFSGLFAGQANVEVTYEQLLGRPREEYRRILDFLGLEYQDPVLRLAIMNPEPLPELITNFDELRSHFTGTNWSWMFD